MERKFKEALAHRRSYYALSNKSLVSNEEIEEIVKFADKIKKDAEFFIKNSASFFASCRTAAYAIP